MMADAEKRRLLDKERVRRAEFEVTDYIGQNIAKNAHKAHRRRRH